MLPELLTFIDCCQTLIGQLALQEITPGDPQVQRCLSSPPVAGMPAEQLVIDAVSQRLKVACARMAPPPNDCREVGLGRLSDTSQAFSNDLVARVLNYIQNAHSDSALTASKIALRAGISRWYLGRLLVKSTGYGLRWHLNSVRLAKAERLLMSSRLSVKEIAYNVGYSGSSELSRQMRARTGLTPSEFRHTARRAVRE